MCIRDSCCAIVVHLIVKVALIPPSARPAIPATQWSVDYVFHVAVLAPVANQLISAPFAHQVTIYQAIPVRVACPTAKPAQIQPPAPLAPQDITSMVHHITIYRSAVHKLSDQLRELLVIYCLHGLYQWVLSI